MQQTNLVLTNQDWAIISSECVATDFSAHTLQNAFALTLFRYGRACVCLSGNRSRSTHAVFVSLSFFKSNRAFFKRKAFSAYVKV